jgi:hypothetical protein
MGTTVVVAFSTPNGEWHVVTVSFPGVIQIGPATESSVLANKLTSEAMLDGMLLGPNEEQVRRGDPVVVIFTEEEFVNEVSFARIISGGLGADEILTNGGGDMNMLRGIGIVFSPR